MIARGLTAMALLVSVPAFAQDVPGIEICTVEKKMDRRTSCLQSNVEFLVKTIAKLRSDHEQKLDAVNRQIATIGAKVVELQKTVDEMKAKAVAPTSKDAPAPPAATNDSTKGAPAR